MIDMLSIDEAIAHAREVAKENREKPISTIQEEIDFMRCARENEQLAEWLEELKTNRIALEKANGYLEANYRLGYNKAIDDFVIKIKERVGMDWEWDFFFIEEIAEQLKAGNSNGL